MKNYSAHWRITILAAIILNFVAISAWAYVLPRLTPEPKKQVVSEVEWIDVDMTEEIPTEEAEIIPEEEVSKPVEVFNASDLVVEELPPPKPFEMPKISEREIPKPKVSQQKPKENPKPPPVVEQVPPPKVEEPAQEGTQLLTQPPVTVMEVRPDKNKMGGFKGYIAFAVRIGKDGKVKSTEILQSSGIAEVDAVATEAVAKWTFRPALDQFNKPMECDKIVTFDFTK
ncbi:MAG: TonB family protein [Selenomonadaceae bacterium]|nr:TonB family protein [Selenomonadaceae bacterium]